MGRDNARRLFMAGLAVMFAVVLAGCGGGNGPVIFNLDYAFSGFNGTDWDIYTVQGGVATALAGLRAGDQVNPSLSWDRTRLVYEDRSAGRGQIVMYDTRAERELWIKLTLTDDMEPEISPAGDMVVFSRRDATDADLWLCNADGGNLLHLTDFPGDELDPTWSSDGRAIYFAWNQGGEFDIWRIELQGAGLTRITQDAGNERWPTMRSSREGLVYANDADGDWELYYKDARRIDNPATRVTNDTDDDIEPAWLRTGNQNDILYATDAGGGWSLRLQKIDPLGVPGAVALPVPARQPSY